MPHLAKRNPSLSPEIKISHLVDYETSLQEMNKRVADIYNNKANELVWFLEHPPLYSAGTSAKPEDLFNPHHFPTYQAGRGGQWTYHGPGQRIIYLMLNLANRKKDVRHFIKQIERWMIASLGELNVKAFPHKNEIGVWVKTPKGICKIAAIGLRLRKWISFHGASINLSPNLSHFRGIRPCGLQGTDITSLKALGVNIKMEQLDKILKNQFQKFF